MSDYSDVAKESVFGVEMVALPDGVTALECLVSVKALDDEGRVRLFERSSEGLTGWEALGMASTLRDSLAQSLTREDDGE